ncbi:Rv3235 family protein, partial [Curtobacterium sp. CT11-45]|uniref:Rv3235 family protein n=1 Tax=Curtobacterium sp. CT11-45 TaxID=3243037 RepID=UPI0039B01940
MAEEARRIDDAEPMGDVPRLSAVPPPTDVEDTARALGLCVAEILTGSREVDSIARWITDEVHRHLQQRAAHDHAADPEQRSSARPAAELPGP